MNKKKLIIATLATIACINNTIDTSYTVNANYSRTFTRKFPVWLSKAPLGIGRGILRSWTLSFGTAPLWAIPTTILCSIPFTIAFEETAKRCLPERVLKSKIGQYVVHPNLNEIQQEHDQNLQQVSQTYEQELNKASQQHKQELDAINQQLQSVKKSADESTIKTAAITTAILGTIWVVNHYKDKIINWFTKDNSSENDTPKNPENHKPSINNILQNSNTVAEAVQKLTLNGYTKNDFLQTRLIVIPGKFSPKEFKQIERALA